jgi:hypothetical protein
MKVISLGYTCYVKSLIKNTRSDGETNIFDWINSFYFEKLIASIENNFNIFEELTKSAEITDTRLPVYINRRYSFRLPHETDIAISVETYKRRFERFKDYRSIPDNYLFMRMINLKGRYEYPPEEIEENYGEKCYERLMKLLPPNSKVLLFTNEKMPDDIKSLFHKGFIVVDNVMNPEHIFYGKYMELGAQIIDSYRKCLDYIEKHFSDLDPLVIQALISNDKLRIVTTEL